MIYPYVWTMSTWLWFDIIVPHPVEIVGLASRNQSWLDNSPVRWFSQPMCHVPSLGTAMAKFERVVHAHPDLGLFSFLLSPWGFYCGFTMKKWSCYHENMLIQVYSCGCSHGNFSWHVDLSLEMGLEWWCIGGYWGHNGMFYDQQIVSVGRQIGYPKTGI